MTKVIFKKSLDNAMKKAHPPAANEPFIVIIVLLEQ